MVMRDPDQPAKDAEPEKPMPVVTTPWAPPREHVAAHAAHGHRALVGVAEDDEAAAMLLAYGQAEAATVFIKENQSPEAAIALLEVFIAVLRAPVPTNLNLPPLGQTLQ